MWGHLLLELAHFEPTVHAEGGTGLEKPKAVKMPTGGDSPRFDSLLAMVWFSAQRVDRDDLAACCMGQRGASASVSSTSALDFMTTLMACGSDWVSEPVCAFLMQ